jgi:hypothetical protein
MIKTWQALLIYLGLMTGGYIWATFWESAPFLAFATQLTIGFLGYTGKRLWQKKINNEHTEDMSEE